MLEEDENPTTNMYHNHEEPNNIISPSITNLGNKKD